MKVILFYNYVVLDAELEAEEQRVQTADLTGRVLLSTEGVNGTLAGAEADINRYCEYMKAHPKFKMTDADFKVSTSEESPFPDLMVKVVSEIISTGGVFSSIPVEETGKGLLTPEQWHQELLSKDQNTVMIDVRNHKEYQIGRFEGATDPNTRTFAEFPKWVENNKANLHGKKVLMYCTGGIRCEKASAFLRRQVADTDVFHLHGGIHKYLDKYGSDGLFKGKNYIFDQRGADDRPAGTVGQCIYCETPYDEFKGKVVCCVCREPVLCCDACQRQEYHCEQHLDLQKCYFADLSKFDKGSLQSQLDELNTHLQKIGVGKVFKNRRRTLHLQIQRVTAALEGGCAAPLGCRNCGGQECDGNCWGFHGTTRKAETFGNAKTARPSRNKRQKTLAAKDRAKLEQEEIGAPASAHRDSATGLRVPPPFMRTIVTTVKARWAGRTLLDVFTEEFKHHGTQTEFEEKIEAGALFVDREDGNVTLQNGDIVTHKMLWHEPPVHVPDHIDIQRVKIPDQEGQLFVVDKPGTVPVHPCGPYLSNSLSVMLEAQEGLDKCSLAPCHRLDRETSGLVLFAAHTKLAGWVTRQIELGKVSKTYLARVEGKFPGVVTVDQPIVTVDPAEGLRAVGEGKAAKSEFELLSYDADTDTSLVRAMPITGRTHQLRVHLQWLKHPIVNDVKYGGARVAAFEECLLEASRVAPQGATFSEAQLAGRAGEIHLHAWYVTLPDSQELRVPPPAWAKKILENH